MDTAYLPDSSGSISMLLEHAPRGGSMFAVSGALLDPEAVNAMSNAMAPNAMAVEISTKPLISLLWIGSLLLFIGGALALTVGATEREIALPNERMNAQQSGPGARSDAGEVVLNSGKSPGR